MRRPLSLGIACLAVLAGCAQDLPAGPTAPGSRGAVPGVPVTTRGSSVPVGVAATHGPASAGPNPVASNTGPVSAPVSPSTPATPAAVAAPQGKRSTTDRPDDAPGYQVHLLYVLPADGADEQLDTAGAIATSVAAANAWFQGQTGTPLRLDTYQGQPDITFYRSPHTHAQLGTDGEARTAAVDKELQAAGFLAPMKIYAYFYGGGETPAGQPALSTLGWGGNGFAGVLLKAADIPLATSPDQAGVMEWTLLHECLHAMGFVPACAPHVTSDSHTQDDPRDLMSPQQNGDAPVIDPGNDDYFRANIAGCQDLAKSPFLNPTPADAQIPLGYPVALAPGENAAPVHAAYTSATLPGDASVEQAAADRINAARQAAGKPVLPLVPALSLAARRLAGDQHGDAARAAADVGFASQLGCGGTGTTELADTLVTALVGTSSARTVIADAQATGMGVGVASGGGFTWALVAYTDEKLIVNSATVGESDFNTYTVALALTPTPGYAGGLGRVIVDGQPGQAFRVVPGSPLQLYASVPRDAKHKVEVGLATADGTHYDIDQSFTVDGTAPVASALTAGE